MKKPAFLTIQIALLLLMKLTMYAQNQNNPVVPKGQLLPAPEYSLSPGTINFINNAQANTIFSEAFESVNPSWTTQEDITIGVPANGPQSGYQSRSCVATTLSGEYSNNANGLLLSPPIELPRINNASRILLNFWQWFEIESQHDKGVVKMTTDGGNTWRTCKEFSGQSDWQEECIELTYFEGKTIQLAFEFTSDESNTYAGWFIDDVTITVYGSYNYGINIPTDGIGDVITAGFNGVSHQGFPFIYTNVGVDSLGTTLTDLDSSNFAVFENGNPQTSFFEVSPPDTGSSDSRLADITFVLDVSGSMGEEIDSVRKHMRSFILELDASGIDYRIGFNVFADIVYTYNNGNLYADTNDILQVIENIELGENGIGYGGGLSENQLGAIAEAATMNYRPGAHRVQIMLTDAPAHYAGDGDLDDGGGEEVTEWTVQSLIDERIIPCF